VRNGLSAQWSLECAMDVKVHNARYIAQWTLQCVMDVKARNGLSAQ